MEMALVQSGTNCIMAAALVHVWPTFPLSLLSICLHSHILQDQVQGSPSSHKHGSFSVLALYII